MGLTVLAAGTWALHSLYLQECSGISDTGVSKLAKACPALEILDLKGCINVGEFGDNALKDLGAFCGNLKYLDLTGCKRVEDAGLRSLAVGCTGLEYLSFSNCVGVTGVGFKALCKNSRNMRTLVLRGCTQLSDTECEHLHGSVLRNTLTHLDVSGCARITDRGIATIAQALGSRLKTLCLSGCNASDSAAVAIGRLLTDLRELDMSRCPRVSDASVHTLACTVSGLYSLKLDGDPKVSVQALLSHIGTNVKFASMAKHWLGYEPKSLHVETLIVQHQQDALHVSAVRIIQSVVRRKIAYRVYRERKRWWLLNIVLPKAQACYRGYIQRKRWNVVMQRLHRIRMTVRIQTWYRKYYQIRKRLNLLKARRFLAYKQVQAVRIQKVYWGMLGRRRVQDLRNALANQRLDAAKHRAQQELSARNIQRMFRAYLARKVSSEQLGRLARMRARVLLQERMARYLQRKVRGMFGRLRAHRQRRYLARKVLEWNTARNIQRMFRGFLGRCRAREVRRVRLLDAQHAACGAIQRIFRGFRARLLAAVARALKLLRMKEQRTAVEAQRVVRGWLGRIHARRFKLFMSKRKLDSMACLKIQTIFRGHKGREALEINRQLRGLEDKARPLILLLKALEDSADRTEKAAAKLDFYVTRGADELFEVEREIDQVMHTTNKYTDCSRINGIPQRFLTKYLRVRLKDHYEHEKEVQHVKVVELQKKKVDLRSIERQIEAARRELIPLTTGKVVQIKRERALRLRTRVRFVKRCVASIQALWRGALVRISLQDPVRDYWVQCFDEDQGEKFFYYNTWNHQTLWKMPPAYRYFHNQTEEMGGSRPLNKILLQQLKDSDEAEVYNE